MTTDHEPTVWDYSPLLDNEYKLLRNIVATRTNRIVRWSTRVPWNAFNGELHAAVRNAAHRMTGIEDIVWDKDQGPKLHRLHVAALLQQTERNLTQVRVALERAGYDYVTDEKNYED